MWQKMHGRRSIEVSSLSNVYVHNLCSFDGRQCLLLRTMFQNTIKLEMSYMFLEWRFSMWLCCAVSRSLSCLNSFDPKENLLTPHQKKRHQPVLADAPFSFFFFSELFVLCDFWTCVTVFLLVKTSLEFKLSKKKIIEK